MRHPDNNGPWLASALLLLVLAGASAGCAAATSSRQPVTAPGTTRAATGQQPGTAPSSAATMAGKPFLIQDAANGTTVTVSVGTQVQLLLHSSYWGIKDSSRPDVLTQVGAPVGIPATRTCAPGMGCSSVRATFRAMRAGTAVLIADRTTCGEALMCPPGKRHFRVTVIVAS
jgi:hypothetical protein